MEICAAGSPISSDMLPWIRRVPSNRGRGGSSRTVLPRFPRPSSRRQNGSRSFRRVDAAAVATKKLVPIVGRNESVAGSGSTSALEQLDIERGVCIPFRKYTPESVRNKVLESRGSTLSLLGRGVEIVWNLGLYWSALTYDCLVGRDEEVVPYRARQLRNLLCDLGPSFIKAGQVLANRPDIIREDYMNELCILQDDVPPFPNQ